MRPARKENGRTDVARPSDHFTTTVINSGEAPARALNTNNGDARDVRAFCGQSKASVAHLHTGDDDAHDFHSAS